MKVLNTIFLTICLEASCLILTTHCVDDRQSVGMCNVNNTRKVCCSSFELRNGKCTQCPIGYYSVINSACKQCTNGTFGQKCGRICTCSSNERCNHVDGSCIRDDMITGEKYDKSKSNSPDAPATSNNGDVVTYMTCVAVVSVLVVVCGLIVKNREAICRHQPGKTSVKHLIQKLKQPTFHDGHNKKVAESLYDEINEKYMINFDGE